MKQSMPDSISYARDYAKRWVRKLMERGYSCVDAEREVYMGYSGPGEAGYTVSRGKIKIPNYHVIPANYWTFSFRQLADELNQPEQLMLL